MNISCEYCTTIIIPSGLTFAFTKAIGWFAHRYITITTEIEVVNKMMELLDDILIQTNLP